MSNKLLIIEPDEGVGGELQRLLEEQTYEVTRIPETHKILESTTFDLILISDAVQGPLGEHLKTLLSLHPKTPIFVLAHRQDEDSAVDALTSGASDYIRRPLSPRELLGRLRRSLRMESQSPQLRYGDLLLQVDQRRLLYRDSEITVKRREFDILSLFVRNKGMVITRENLILSLNRDSEMLHRTIDTHVSHLRRKLRVAGVNFIRITSVYGVGYRLDGGERELKI